MKEEQIKEIIKNRLSNERYYHSICVANQCEILAKQYNINIVNARLVGLVHDIAKELSKEEKINYAIKNNITIDEIEKIKPGLLHGKIAADIAKKEFGFTEEMSQAITCHTTGKENMSSLDKILFVSDAVSQDRQWPDIQNIRNLAKENLNEAVLYILNMIIKEKINNKELLHINSILARNNILKEIM